LRLIDRRSACIPPRLYTAAPLIRSSRNDKLVIDSEKIYEIIDFP